MGGQAKVNHYIGRGASRSTNRNQFILNSIYRHLQKQDRAHSLKVGDKVRLNISAITSRSDYWKMNPLYQKFVEENGQTIFTVKRDEKNKNIHSVVTFEEDDTWLFWIHDLNVVS